MIVPGYPAAANWLLAARPFWLTSAISTTFELLEIDSEVKIFRAPGSLRPFILLSVKSNRLRVIALWGAPSIFRR